MTRMLWLLGFVSIAMMHCNGLDEVVDVCGGSGQLTRLDISDTTVAGTVLANSSMSFQPNGACSNAIQFNQNDSTLILTKDASTICDVSIECRVSCGGTIGTMTLLVSIIRTLEYNITFKFPVYNGTVVEMASNGTHVELQNYSLSVDVLTCSYYTPIGVRMEFALLNKEYLPFTWATETDGNALKVAGLIDYEKNTTFTMLIQGVQKINPAKPSTATTTIFIKVTDIDDNKPEFSIPSTESYVLEIDENKHFEDPLTSTPAIYAFDPDKGPNTTQPIQYSFIDTDGGPFTINESDGKIGVNQVLDYETKPIYTVAVKAAQKDQPQTRFTIATLIVKVQDVDDHIPEFIRDSYDCSVVEHSSVGTIVCSVSAVDKDTKPEYKNFTYIIWGGNDVVSIGEHNGVISVSNSTELDRESSGVGDQFIIQVGTLTLNGSYGDNVTVTINVIDINDNNPEFSEDGTYNFNLGSTTTGSIVGTVVATDNDADENGRVMYEILATPVTSGCTVSTAPGTNPFGINTTSGEVTVASANIVCKHYQFMVQACDHGLNRRCTIASVVIENAKAGDLQNVSLSLDVAEGMPIDSFIGFDLCCDKQRVYEYIGGPKFNIDNNTGMMVTKQILDREDKDQYNFLIKIKSAATLLWNVNVTITVTDINDNRPEFEQLFYHFTLPSSPVPDATIGTLKVSIALRSVFRGLIHQHFPSDITFYDHATDADIDENGNISYYLKDSPLMMINQTTGILSIKATSIERIDIVRTYVVAMDNGSPALQSNIPVYISNSNDAGSIPISSPMTVDIINAGKTKLAGEISEILNTVVVIRSVTPVSGQGTFKSKVHIAPQTNAKSLDENFLSAVVSHYEEVKDVFYQPSSQVASDVEDKSGLAAPEIGLIVMACVILVGTIAAIIIIQRQFSSQKRYRQLFETMTKNSSMYESQELKMDVEDEVSNANNGSIKEEDFGKTSTPPSLMLATSAQNPAYVHTDEGNNVTLNGSVGQYENCDVNNALKELTDSYEQEDHDVSANNDGERNQSTGSSPVVYANVHKTDDVDDVVFVVDIEPEIEGNNDNELDQDNSDLNHFDSVSNGELQTVAASNKNESEPVNVDIEDEPNPDYDVKQVRFHSEVLDAGENKIEPLKVKGEGTGTKDIGTDDIVNEEDDGDDGVEADQTDGSATNVSQTSGYSSDTSSSEENDSDTIGTQDANKERLEEEIDAPEKDQFYFENIESTHF